MNHKALLPFRSWITGLIAVALLLSACAAPTAQPAAPAAGDQPAAAAPAEEEVTISFSGAFALFPLVVKWTEEYQKLHPNIKFDVQGGGAGKGMTDMLAGAADVAMLSREPRQEELDQGSFLVPVTIDAVVGTFNANNPYREELLAQGISAEESHNIWITGEITTWRDLLGVDSDDAINVYTRSDASGAGEMWAKFSGADVQDDLLGTAVNADPGLAEAVRQDPLGVGYNNIGFTYDLATGLPNEGLQVIPIDLNGDGVINEDEAFYDTIQEIGQAIAEERYPYPPARPLYLVTKGRPSPAILDFYRWVLTDGQAFVADAGYINLPEQRIQEALASLEE